MKELGLSGVGDYQNYLVDHPEEWSVLDGLCRITISRFFRDREVWRRIQGEVFPDLAQRAKKEGRGDLRVWSAGCGSGEEPYTLSMLWRLPSESKESLADTYPELRFHVLGTDAGADMLGRAERAVYPAGSLKELPPAWVSSAFRDTEEGFALLPEFKEDVSFTLQDVRKMTESAGCDLIACRNLAFTYFQEELQVEILDKLTRLLTPGGYLVIGSHEDLPSGPWPLTREVPGLPVFRLS
jgi:chemotaxis protein methyltransferase CheR